MSASSGAQVLGFWTVGAVLRPIFVRERLTLGPEWLRFGQQDNAAPTARQSLARYRTVLSDQELVRRFRKLGNDQQLALAEIITALSEPKAID